MTLKEAEINYLIDMLKRRDRSQATEVIKISVLKKYFEKAQRTLEILMAKMGLRLVYQKLIYIYK